jgi:hypothetical protein
VTGTEVRAAIQRAMDEAESVFVALPWPCTDLRVVAGHQLTCVQRGPGDPVHWSSTSPCVRCRLLLCLHTVVQKLHGAANWSRGLP